MAVPPQQATAVACGDENAVAGHPGAAVITGAQPGETDPMNVPAGRYQLFPDQGVGAFQPGTGNTLQTLFYQTDGDSTLSLDNSSVVQSQPWSPNPIFAASGRILTPDHENLVYATRSGNPTEHGTVNISFSQEGPSTTLPGTLLPRAKDSTDFIAIAQGDLDHVVGADGNYHNQVVVVRASGQSTAGGITYIGYNIDVLNYGSGDVASPDITNSYFVDIGPEFNINPGSIANVLPVDNIVGVAVGDFEGDGREEIAVAALGHGTVYLYTYRYRTVNGVHSLTQISSRFWTTQGFAPAGLPMVGTLSLVAGDFDGDGADEVALGYAKWGLYPSNTSYGTFGIGTLIFKYNRDTPELKNSSFSLTAARPHDKSFAYEFRPRVQLAPGQFLFQPPDFVFGRRQLAIAWNDSGLQYSSFEGPRELHVAAVTMSTDLSSESLLGNVFNINTYYPAPRQVYSMAVGGFQGVNTPTTNVNSTKGAPISSLAVGYWLGAPGSTTTAFQVRTFQVLASGPSEIDQTSVNVPMAIDETARLPLVAYDLQGKSLYLGSPAHLTVHGAARTDEILQEPPKHVYWDENTEQVINLTRTDGNNVHLYNSTTSSLATSSIDESSRNTGGSIAASAGLTVGYKKNLGIASTSTELSADVTARGDYDYKEHEEEYNSGYNTRTFSSMSSTDHDDYLRGETQLFDVWRYRAYGAPPQGETNTFYEMVLPGPKVSFSGGGLNFDWYQPSHENGNILSYPAALGPAGNPYIPEDLGPYTLPNGMMPKEPQVPAALSYFDGTGGSTELKYSSEVTSGKSFSYSHELAESADVKVAYTASGQIFGVSGEARVCGSVEFHNSNSWGKTQTSNQVSKTETAITLNKASGVSAYAYPFFPVVYTTTDGTLKMSFAVPNPAGSSLNPAGYETYANLYGIKPDPALNLPFRFYSFTITPGQVGWLPTLANSRKQMRGLFFRQSTVDPDTGTYDFLSANPAPGDIVRIEPRIYNYSTGQTASNISVVFQAIPYNSNSNSELCSSPINSTNGGAICPASARTTIGETTIRSLNSLQFTCLDGTDNEPINVTGCADPVYINWDTSNFGSSGPGTNAYRVYVVLNPGSSAGKETYGGEGPPVAITHVSSTTPLVATAPGNRFSVGEYVTIGGVKGLTEAKGIFGVGSISGDEFTLEPCQPAPPCSIRSVPGRIPYESGGTATLLDPGQNNEGYGYIAITTPSNVAAAETNAPRDYLESDSLGVVGENVHHDLALNQASAMMNVPLQLRFKAYSSAVHSDAAQVLFFDGDPRKGASAMAEKVIHPGENGRAGASVWLDWTPTTLGEHHLYAVLEEGSGTQQIAQINVVVGMH